MTRLFRYLLALTFVSVLAGCGGGVAVGLDLGYGGVYYETPPDGRPAVSLASSATVARRGDPVRLVAAATDDYRVDSVTFFQVTAQGSLSPVTTLRSPPYSIDVVMPNSGESVVYFQARAVDDVGQYSDSSVIAINLIP